MALGEKKVKVILQILLEVLAIGIIAISLSLVTGSLIAENISENMIRQNSIARQQESDREPVLTATSEHLNWFVTNEMSIEEMMEMYQITLDVKTIVLFYGIGLGTILISTVLPIVYIIKLEPKKILM